ncbi:hypothetical protein, partial [uncultured Sphingomonas sp.]|uniref:hypothetical protein n=1 Tax=uncultured Sphingomonas sp. TaxID=158754 RepID=UPI0025F301A7
TETRRQKRLGKPTLIHPDPFRCSPAVNQIHHRQSATFAEVSRRRESIVAGGRETDDVQRHFILASRE